MLLRFLKYINLNLDTEMNKITIYLPIEIKVRELNSHVLLSKFASKLGMRIYIGSKDAIKRLLKKKKW